MMPTQTSIHTIRHAQTAYNHEKRYAGSIDVPLSPQGAEACLRAAERLAASRFDVVIASRTRRAADTARLLVGDGAELILDDLCVERRFGIMEGLTWDEVRSLDPPILFIEVGGELHSVNPQGAEPFEDLWERAKRFRREIFRSHMGKSVLVISHGVFLQMFHGLLEGRSCIESLGQYPRNLQLTTFAFEDDCLVQRTSVVLADHAESHF